MIPVAPVVRLARRWAQQLRDEVHVKCGKEERSVKQEPFAFASLGVSGKLAIIAGEIGVPGGDHRVAEQ